MVQGCTVHEPKGGIFLITAGGTDQPTLNATSIEANPLKQLLRYILRTQLSC